MIRKILPFVVAGVLLLMLIQLGEAQRSAPRRRRPPAKAPPAKSKREWPKDKKLLNLYVDFVASAEKLAREYEKQKDYDRARSVYKEILKIVPEHARSKKKIEEFFAKEVDAQRKIVEVEANKGWQDTGVRLIQGKPITLRASGTWTFNMSHKLGPAGMEIPKELRDFNLGSLIATVVTEKHHVKVSPKGPGKGSAKGPKPFVVGAEKQFIAAQSGRLMLRMYDADARDNIGKLRVEIVGTFETK